ncbi:Hint domain-containing protein [Albidovulum inexpectatum]|uniref:Hint domain-containing protein n=1 Tax=Albidovulum inexpectatum TaxID=196587 RepID=A0A2S5JEU9_9RHOB|nr:Hint domain-containing protein [Albidovulum inexpectatum]PPB80027.1 Hint domain-containing protein [Albidovulum inexpectatum]
MHHPRQGLIEARERHIQAPGSETTDSRESGPRRRRKKVWTLPGIVGTMRIHTEFGEVPVEALRANDRILGIRGETARIAKVDSYHLDADFLSLTPDALPVLVPAGSLGAGLPTQDLMISPHQRVSIKPGSFRHHYRMARDLVGTKGIRRSQTHGVSYHAIRLAAPGQICLYGAILAAATR